MPNNPNDAPDLTALTFTKLAHLSYQGELKPYLDTICASIIELLGDGIAAVNFYKNNKKFVLAVFPQEIHRKEALDVHGYLSTYVVNHKHTLTVEDASLTPQFGKPPDGFCSYLGVPLRLPGGQVVGTLCYFNRHRRRFTHKEQQVSEMFAERAAIALDNFEQFQQLKHYSDTLEDQVRQRSQELLQVREELAQKEKLAAVGEFASRITHEIRNPLATIGLALDYLKKTPDQKAAKRAVLAANEVKRLENLLNEVLLYAKPVQLNLRPLALAPWLEDFLITYASLAEQAGIRFRHEKLAPATVMADPDKMTQVCLNLLRNACDAAPAHSIIDWTSGLDGKSGKISIHNGGDAIPAAKLQHITEPFISAKAGGSGLGLAIVTSIMSAHQGSLGIDSAPDAGTTVTLRLPLAAT